MNDGGKTISKTNESQSEAQMVNCRNCGHPIHETATACPQCGAPNSASSKRILPAALLCFFFGLFGFHRFYVGKIWTGLLQLITGGGFVIWAVIDFIFIIIGGFTDKQGNKITLWT
jgi:TM2 domain-containing membrane protein YozV